MPLWMMSGRAAGVAAVGAVWLASAHGPLAGGPWHRPRGLQALALLLLWAAAACLGRVLQGLTVAFVMLSALMAAAVLLPHLGALWRVRPGVR